jgi:hypothetical protein
MVLNVETIAENILTLLQAEQLFVRVRNMDSVRSEDMEVFSTILWHQRKDVDLFPSS